MSSVRVKSPVGNLRVTFDARSRIQSVDFTEKESKSPWFTIPELDRFFKVGDCYHLHLTGTDFQKQVWKELQKIPPGETRTYSQIAEQIGKPTAYRAVVNACGANPIALLVPCHRVVAKSGLGGYRWGPEKKEMLQWFEKTLTDIPDLSQILKRHHSQATLDSNVEEHLLEKLSFLMQSWVQENAGEMTLEDLEQIIQDRIPDDLQEDFFQTLDSILGQIRDFENRKDPVFRPSWIESRVDVKMDIPTLLVLGAILDKIAEEILKTVVEETGGQVKTISLRMLNAGMAKSSYHKLI